MDNYRNKNRFAPYDPRGPPPRPYQQQHFDNYRNDPPRRGGGGGPMRGRGGHRGGYGGPHPPHPPHRRNDYENRGMYNMPYQSQPPMSPQSHQPQWNQPRNDGWHNDFQHGYEPSHSPDRPRFQPGNNSRAARERPSRTLFVRNIEYDMDARELGDIFGKFGEIKGEVFDLIERRGMAFVTFFDLRDAERAKEEMHDAMLGGRPVEVHFALPKDEEEHVRCDKTKNQGTLLLTLQNSDYTLDDNELHEQFSQYGEIKVIRVPFFKRPSENAQRRQRFIEFWDSRACVEAFDDTHGKPYKDGKWDVTFFWDHTPKDRQEAQRRDRVMEDPRRDNDSYSSDSHNRVGRDDHRGGGRDRFRKGGRDSRDDEYNDRNSSAQDAYYDYGQRDNNVHVPYDPERPTTNYDETRDQLEKAQKAQQVLSMLAQAQTMQNVQQPTSQTPYSQYGGTTQQYVPLAGESTAPSFQQQPDNQVQQLLGLLSQVAQQQQQQQQQPVPQVSPPQSTQQAAPAVDPAAALTQLAQLLQQQKTQQPQEQPAGEQSDANQTTSFASQDQQGQQ